MDIEVVSKYKDYPIASRKKAFFAVVIDYFTVFLVTLSLFYFAIPIASFLPASIENITGLDSTREEALKFVNASHLLHYTFKESGNIIQRDVEVDAKNYLVSLTKTSAYIYDIPYPFENDDGTFDKNRKVNVEETFLHETNSYALDNISFFLYKFSREYPSINPWEFDGKNYSNDKENYIYNVVMNYNQISNIDTAFVKANDPNLSKNNQNLSRYQLLNLDYTKSFIDILVYDEQTSSNSYNLVTDLLTGYANGIQHCINLLENNCSEYIKISEKFDNYYENYTLFMFIVYFVTYIISFLAVVLVSRLIIKEWSSPGIKGLSLALCRKDELSTSPINLILYYALSFILYSTSMIINFMFTGYLGILNLNIFGNINLMSINAFVLTFDIISIILILFTKNRTSISLYLSSMVLKDTKVLEGTSISDDRLFNETKKSVPDGNKQ